MSSSNTRPKSSPLPKQLIHPSKTTMPRNNRHEVDPAVAIEAMDWKADVEQASILPVFFWRSHDPWGVFSQWYPCPFKDPVSGRTFSCNEQYMMYRKAITFNDKETAEKILATDDARTHKALGRKVRNFVGHDWDKVKYDIVVEANLLKFGHGIVLADDKFVYPPHGKVQGKDSEVSMRQVLLSTGVRDLVEASPMDRIWGIGYSPQHAADVPEVKWGKNLLGKALMNVRERLGNNAEIAGEENNRINEEHERAASLL